MKTNGYLASILWVAIMGGSLYLAVSGGDVVDPQPTTEAQSCTCGCDKCTCGTGVPCTCGCPDCICSTGNKAEFRWVSYSEALSGDKPILVHLGAEWCGPCKNLEHNVLPRPEIVERLKRFSCVLLDVDRKWDNQRTVQQVWRPSSLPYEVIVDPGTMTQIKRGPVPSTVEGYSRYQDGVRVYRSLLPGKKNTYVWKIEK